MLENPSRTRRLVAICALVGLLIGAGALGQQPQGPSEPRRYKAAWTDVPLRSAPRPDAKEIGKVPARTVVEAIEKQDYWVKVKVKNKFGWAASTAMERLMETPVECPRIASTDLDDLRLLATFDTAGELLNSRRVA
jgi:Bacterial SH3 domain